MDPTAIPAHGWDRGLPPSAAPAVSIVRRLQEAGHAAFLVGGAVRDLVLGLRPGDFDVATDARPERIRTLFPVTRLVGASFAVVQVHVDDTPVETATFRVEGPYSDARHPDSIAYAETPGEDARRRDFTVNAMAMPLGNGGLVDPFGGRRHLQEGRLVAVGPRIFADDPLRLLRAARLGV